VFKLTYTPRGYRLFNVMKALFSTFLALTLIVGTITCACDVQASDISMGGMHADHDMSAEMGCDHIECEDDCFKEGTLSTERDASAKAAYSFELDFDDVEASLTNRHVFFAGSIGSTGPPPNPLIAARTPITRHDLLLE